MPEDGGGQVSVWLRFRDARARRATSHLMLGPVEEDPVPDAQHTQP